MRLWGRRRYIYKPRFRKKNNKRRDNKRLNKYLTVTLVILIFIYCFSLFDKRIKPIALSIGEARARYIGIKAINEAVNEKIMENGLKYEDLISFQINSDGIITALQTNVVKMNELKADITMRVQEKITSIETTQIKIPLGNALNSQIFSGVGPKIKLKIVPIGNANADFKTNFEAAGINQTKLEVFFVVSSNIKILMPMASRTVEVVTTVPVAEAIIVGRVPDNYVNIEGVEDKPPDAALNILD